MPHTLHHKRRFKIFTEYNRGRMNIKSDCMLVSAMVHTHDNEIILHQYGGTRWQNL